MIYGYRWKKKKRALSLRVCYRVNCERFLLGTHRLSIVKTSISLFPPYFRNLELDVLNNIFYHHSTIKEYDQKQSKSKKDKRRLKTPPKKKMKSKLKLSLPKKKPQKKALRRKAPKKRISKKKKQLSGGRQRKRSEVSMIRC